MTYTYRKVTEENMPDVATAFNKTRGTAKSTDFFRNKFKSPIGAAYIGYLAYDENNNPVSHAGIIPWLMNYNGREIIVGTFTDTVTVVEHQRKGLFKNVNELVIAEAARLGLQMVFRFPNPNTYNGLMKHLSFSHTYDFYAFSIPMPCIFPVIKVFNKLGLKRLRHWYFKFITMLPGYSATGHMENSVIKEGYAGIVHNEGFFNHKQFSESYFLKLGPDKIWFKPVDGIVIGDMHVQQYDVFLKNLKRFCYTFGIHQVKFIVMGETTAYNKLKQFAVPEKNLPICIRDTSDRKYDLKTVGFCFADHDDF